MTGMAPSPPAGRAGCRQEADKADHRPRRTGGTCPPRVDEPGVARLVHAVT
uniref:hypothetical protein n=1 Tax=Saccharothrix mutabilis TaxID=33921 RepID=UPI0031DF8F06